MSYILRLLSYLLILSTFIGFSQNTFVPDDNFEQALIDLGLDSGPLDDFVLTANINNRQDLYINDRNIVNMRGIEDFTALTILDCSGNQIQILDISNNTRLTQLYTQNNLLTDINVSVHQNLQILWCFNNQISEINVSQNPILISLHCENNNLSSLNTSNNRDLNVLVCENNTISVLDIQNNISLSTLKCGDNLLTELDITKNNILSSLHCEDNQISNLNLENNPRIQNLFCFNNNIFELDLSKNRLLNNLDCSNNNLCLLNIKNRNNANANLINFTGNIDLTCVIVDNFNSNRTNWLPANFTNYVESINECNSNIEVDVLEDVIGVSYILPSLTNGNYFTQPEGKGIMLNAGDIISSSQTIYIYNKETCFSNQSVFDVIISDTPFLIPKYFTPNNDGINDVWKIIDTNNEINNISIFNRYGQLLKFLPSTSQTWDGTFNGEFLPSDTYWYEIVLDSREVLRGYFALKR